MKDMIARLIAGGHAYEAEGHVLFAVESYRDYGALSGRSVDDMIARRPGGGRALQAQPDGFRAVEAFRTTRHPAGTVPGAGGRARLAYRVLCHVQ